MQVTQSLLDGLAESAREHGRLGLDTEFMPEGRYRPLWQDGRRVGFCDRTTVVIGS